MRCFWSICEALGIAILASTVVAVGMNPRLLNPWNSDGIIFWVMGLASLSLFSIVPFYLMEGKRLSKFWRHLIFLGPWIVTAILCTGIFLFLSRDNAGSEAWIGKELCAHAFTFYSIGFWASYIFCFLHRYISSRKTPGVITKENTV